MTGPPVDRFECASCPNLSGCALSVLGEDLAKHGSELRRLRFAPKEMIFHQGAPAAGWYVLCRGGAKLLFKGPRRRAILIKFCRPGDLLEGGGLEVHTVSAVSVLESVVGFIDRSFALRLCERHPELVLDLGRRLAQDRYMLIGRLAYLAYGSIGERLARGLLELGRHYGVRCEGGLLIDLPFTQGDLADPIGTSRQKVNLNLRKFASQGLIRTERGRVIIPDQNGLQKLG